MAEQFCLRWNNHQNTVIAVMDTLLQNNILVDVTLAAEGRSLRAHRVVLSACSPYLEMLLSENTDKHPILLLKDVSFHELESMVAYMYRGEVNISQDELGTFLKAAESLQIKGLADGGDEGNATTTSTNSTPAPRVTVPRRPQAPISAPRATPPTAINRSNNVAAGGLTIEPSHAPRHGSSRVSNSSYDDEASLSPRKRRRTTEAPIPSNPNSASESGDYADTGLLQEKIEPTSESVLMEPKAEYYEEVGPDDNIEDLTLDDDEDPGEGPSGYDNWQLLGEQGGEEYLNNSANQDPNNSQDEDLIDVNAFGDDCQVLQLKFPDNFCNIRVDEKVRLKLMINGVEFQDIDLVDSEDQLNFPNPKTSNARVPLCDEASPSVTVRQAWKDALTRSYIASPKVYESYHDTNKKAPIYKKEVQLLNKLLVEIYGKEKLATEMSGSGSKNMKSAVDEEARMAIKKFLYDLMFAKYGESQELHSRYSHICEDAKMTRFINRKCSTLRRRIHRKSAAMGGGEGAERMIFNEGEDYDSSDDENNMESLRTGLDCNAQIDENMEYSKFYNIKVSERVRMEMLDNGDEFQDISDTSQIARGSRVPLVEGVSPHVTVRKRWLDTVTHSYMVSPGNVKQNYGKKKNVRYVNEVQLLNQILMELYGAEKLAQSLSGNGTRSGKTGVDDDVRYAIKKFFEQIIRQKFGEGVEFNQRYRAVCDDVTLTRLINRKCSTQRRRLQRKEESAKRNALKQGQGRDEQESVEELSSEE